MGQQDVPLPGPLGPGTSRAWRWAIGALRTVAWLLLLAGVWGVPAAFVWYVMPHGADGGLDPWWPLLVTEVAVATLGLSMTTWWVADWLDRPRQHVP